MFSAEEFRPHPLLAPYVKCYWTLKAGNVPETARIKQFLSDSGIKISFNLADTVEFIVNDSRSFSLPEGCVSGALTTNYWVKTSGSMDSFGIQFHPGGAYPFIRAPKKELTDKVFHIEDIWGKQGKQLLNSLRNPELTTKDRIVILESSLLRQLNRMRKRDATFEFALDTLLKSQGRVPIDALAGLTQISRRQLERKFNNHIGVSPKHLGRILRFRHIFDYIAGNPTATWVSMAVSCGYYDQSHFIRDFKLFTGLPPGEFINEIIKKDLFINWGYNFDALSSFVHKYE